MPVYQFAPKDWLGRHQLKAGVDFNHRSYDGTDHSHPIQLTRQDGSLVERSTSRAAACCERRTQKWRSFYRTIGGSTIAWG